eukprot:1601815-Pleurochrysis_carterae.AAC.7
MHHTTPQISSIDGIWLRETHQDRILLNDAVLTRCFLLVWGRPAVYCAEALSSELAHLFLTPSLFFTFPSLCVIIKCDCLSHVPYMQQHYFLSMVACILAAVLAVQLVSPFL